MSDTPETQEAVERWHQGKINIFDEMARLEREREEAHKLAESAMLESDRLRAKLKQARDCFSAAMELAERYKAEIDAMQ